jgi:Domain of unknown function (DUF4926)
VTKRPKLHDVVALLNDTPAHRLSRGQVGTIVDLPDKANALVEFADDEGRAYAIAAIATSQLLLLKYEPEAA